MSQKVLYIEQPPCRVLARIQKLPAQTLIGQYKEYEGLKMTRPLEVLKTIKFMKLYQ